jgi:stalled ribosome rescue protein Dom34
LNNERKLLSDLFDHLAKEDDMVVYGKDDTIKMLEEDSL